LCPLPPVVEKVSHLSGFTFSIVNYAKTFSAQSRHKILIQQQQKKSEKRKGKNQEEERMNTLQCKAKF